MPCRVATRLFFFWEVVALYYELYMLFYNLMLAQHVVKCCAQLVLPFVLCSGLCMWSSRPCTLHASLCAMHSWGASHVFCTALCWLVPVFLVCMHACMHARSGTLSIAATDFCFLLTLFGIFAFFIYV